MQEVGNALAILILFGLYFLPTGIAWRRGKGSVGALVVVNALLGWTMIGWVICLAWSFMPVSSIDEAQRVKNVV